MPFEHIVIVCEWKQVKTQQLHETKKKEKEYIKLQVQFHTTSSTFL